MTPSAIEKHPFIEYLESLRDSEQRGALAALRRGLGRPVGAEPEMLRYVVPWLPVETSPWQEEPYFLVASLFSLHAKPGGSGDMGRHLADAVTRQQRNEAVERRLTALLAAHRDDLPYHLRQAVSLLRSCDVPIAWSRLLKDIQNWDHPDRWVQRNWARSFWSRPGSSEETDQN